MQKVSYIPLENILADDPLPRMSKKGWIFDRRGGCQVTVFDTFNFSINCTCAYYRWLRSLVKHSVAAKHGSSKTLTSNELWLLEMRIKSTRILAPIPDALWDMCKLSIKKIITGFAFFRIGWSFFFFFVFFFFLNVGSGLILGSVWKLTSLKKKKKERTSLAEQVLMAEQGPFVVS